MNAPEVKTKSFTNLAREIKENKAVVLTVAVDDSFSDQEIAQMRGAGMDAVELRIDLFENQELSHIFKQIKRYEPLPIIATIRITQEGGKWAGDKAKRQELLGAIAPFVNAVDIELSASCDISDTVKSIQQSPCDLIISYHDFTKTPAKEKLIDVVQRAKAIGANIIKIACHIETETDVVKLASVFEMAADIPKIILGMGPKGVCARVAFPSMGSLITFASSGRFSTAPGQVPLSQMVKWVKDIYPK